MILTANLIRKILIPSAVVLAVLTGCGPSRAPVVPVTGKVTFKGQPVDGATVVFFLDGSGTPATGITKADGTFSLTSHEPNDGAPEGNHKVTVTKIESSGPEVPKGESMEAAAARQAKGPAENKVTVVLPPKYSSVSSTPLSFKVARGEKNHFDIEVTE